MHKEKEEVVNLLLESRETLDDYDQEILLKALIIDYFFYIDKFDNSVTEQDKDKYNALFLNTKFFIDFICTKNNKELDVRKFNRKNIENEFYKTFNISESVGEC